MTHTPEQLRKALEIAYLVVTERERRRTRAVAHQAALAAIVATEADVTERMARIAGDYPDFGPRDAFNRGIHRGRELAAQAIRKHLREPSAS